MSVYIIKELMTIFAINASILWIIEYLIGLIQNNCEKNIVNGNNETNIYSISVCTVLFVKK